MTFERLHAVLAIVADARPLGPVLIYELNPGSFSFSRRTRMLARRPARALSALRDVGWPVFAAGALGDPRGEHLGGAWEMAAANTWLVPPEAVGDALRDRWLAGGDSLASAMSHGIAALLDSPREGSASRVSCRRARCRR